MEDIEITSNYKVICKLGQGSFGSAYKVQNKKDNKFYVIKQILLKEELKNEEIKNIKNEALLLKSINNKNIVKCYDSFFNKNTYNIILEYCDGLDLRQYIDKYKAQKQSINQDIIFNFIFDIINGLKEIHSKNLIHRDLKPENLFLTSKNTIKIGDFGLVKQLNMTRYATTQAGTFNYSAPEIINGQKYNNKVDLWALGCIIYELCTLEICFECEFVLGLCNKIMKGEHGKINKKIYKLELQNLIDLLLKKNYKERPDIKEVQNYAIKYFSQPNQLSLSVKNNKEEDKNILTIDPFKILGIKEEECRKMNPNNIERDYKDLIIDRYRELKALNKNDKNILLSYYIVFNMNKFDRKENIFSINKKDHFYYVIMNDLNNLKILYEKNKYILCEKDNFQRTLLHLSVIGEYYEICKFLLEKGINFDEPDSFLSTALFYSKDKIKKLIKSYGAREEIYNTGNIPKGINIDYKDNNKIDIICKDFLNRKIITKVEFIKKNNEIIGKRLVRAKIFDVDYKDQIYKCELKAYHGTKFVSMEHILIYGLHYYGEPSYGNIPKGVKVNNVENWANSIFLTPSIFYASKYAEIINSEKEEWFIIIEAMIAPKFFKEYESTIYKYNHKMGEPKKLEYRWEGDYLDGCCCCWYDEGGIKTTSLLFVKKKFLENLKDYFESKIFEN